MKLLSLFTFLNLLLLSAQDTCETQLPKLSVVQVEDTSSISPRFLCTVSAEEGKFRVLKGIYTNRQNLDGIQATLVTPLGDTALLVFPEISADALANTKSESISLYVTKDYPFSIEFDLHTHWAQFQESTDIYIGPYPGTYNIRFELGWSEKNWENLIASGILRGWEKILINESLFSKWVSFSLDEDVFITPDTSHKPRKIEHQASIDYDLYVVQNEGLISQQWLIDPETNSEMLVVNHDEPLAIPSQWEKGAFFFGVYPLDIKRFEQWTPTDSISGRFTAYSTHRNKREQLQEFTGQFVLGNIDGELDFRFPFRQNIQKSIHGRFKQGKMDGQWVEQQILTEKETHQVLAEQSYKQGAKNGWCREYYSNAYGGGIKKETLYLDDKINGTSKFYYQNGQLGSVENYLPKLVFRSVKHNEESQFQFPISAVSQIKHGEFLSYFEDGSVRHSITYRENIPVGICEFYYRYGKKEYHTLGSFKDGEYFEGTFIYRERVKNTGYGRQTAYHNKWWILHYHEGALVEKELIFDTSKDPLLTPKQKKK